MTAIVYFGEMLVASVLAIVLLAISRLPMSSGTVLFGGGVIGWTLGEYAVHRFVLHYRAPREHGLHHANPDEAVLTVFWQISFKIIAATPWLAASGSGVVIRDALSRISFWEGLVRPLRRLTCGVVSTR